MIKLLTTGILFLSCISLSFSQSTRPAQFIGINPSVTIEPYYEKGELDVNIVPVVYQLSVAKRVDLRMTSILNLGIRKNGNEISHWGLEAAAPIYFRAKESKTEFSKGFFAAPVLSFTRNNSANHYNIGVWAEPGYHLLFENSFAFSFGLQVGATYFMYDNDEQKWGNHFGAKVVFGKWF